MNYRREYEKWLESSYVDEATKDELRNLTEEEIEDRFYKNLEFGTGGLRGIMGAGINRMNFYTVRAATQGLANYILAEAQGDDIIKGQGVAIAHDSRHNSDVFAREAALVLNANGIPAYLFNALRTTPFLSFAVRHLGCVAGIMITASHNPKAYNGYKAYWSDGAQVVYPRDEAIIAEVAKIADFSQVSSMLLEEARAKGLFRMCGDEVDEAFVQNVLEASPQNVENKDLSIVYTPLHGGGAGSVARVLRAAGFENVHLVKEQAEPDPDFSSVASPNPEDAVAFELALELAREIGAQAVMASDPDADRLGIYVRDKNGAYTLLTGNMIGILIADYIINKSELLPKNGVIISTIVSTRMVQKIVQAAGLEFVEVLTGFKYIGEKIRQYEDGSRRFLFGFEESYGYLAGTYARDKDSSIAALLFAKLCAEAVSGGKTIPELLEGLYEKYGYFKEVTHSISFDGLTGITKMQAIMAHFRAHPPLCVAGANVCEVVDYLNDERRNPQTPKEKPLSTGLPASDVIVYKLEDGSWFAVRPSGTEPKMKIYLGVEATSQLEADEKLTRISSEIRETISKL